MSIEELKILHEVGIGTFQVFQETYHRPTYERLHPQNTIKGDYLWRLYAMHRSMEAGVDDVGLGALLGLHDWKFEVMGLLYHAIELEAKFGIGPHTISFPRIEPAHNTPLAERLSVIDPTDYPDTNELRGHLLDVIDSELNQGKQIAAAPDDNLFDFGPGIGLAGFLRFPGGGGVA